MEEKYATQPLQEGGEDDPVRIEDVRAISSFNKIANNQIAVPGVPPRLHPLTQRLKVELDYDNKSLGRNYPTYTHHFEPLIRSIEATDPGYDLTKIDIVTNASNLRKMFMLFLNRQMEYQRYDLTWRDNTLVVSKWVSDPHLNSSLGHGTGFEQATCIYDDHEDEVLKSSTSHHRVIQYRFGGLHLVVQSEVDAYHCDCHCPSAGNVDPALPETSSALTINEVVQHRRRSSSGQTSKLSTVFSSDFSVTSIDCHRDATRETSPMSPPPSPCLPKSTGDLEPPITGVPPASAENVAFSSANSSPTLDVLRLGREIPAQCLVEVKTHKVNNQPFFNAEAQLYFAQVSKLYIAQNDNGSFSPTTVLRNNNNNKTSSAVQDKTEDIRQWAEAEQNQRQLRKVVALLKKLRELAERYEKEKGVGRLTVLMRNDGLGEESGVKVTLYERMGDEGEGSGCLPGDGAGGEGFKESHGLGREGGGRGAGGHNPEEEGWIQVLFRCLTV
ncbi:hypothetical protein QBC32DRAFT_396206 [Pseudoneurospora amorphoporcata]|uniref:Uncharacterized protein n=1 Tax=Pseudoneurospora amorphoporcata TaxID=241081 RepID=A0AAN6P0R8_9PEZI|nr:hypothetical protein QBC32DRAFT_396206 [Pseudoneurospora amorphoporcata]